MDLYTYQALVATNGPDGLHKRVSVEARSVAEATKLLAEEYGADNVVSVWGGWEAEQIRRDK